MKTLRVFYIVSLLLATSISAFCQKQPVPDKIRSIVVTEEKYDMLVKKQYKESETYYDTRGNVTESVTYKQGKVDKHFKYTYDNDNNKIKEEEYDPTGRLKEYSEYKFSDGLRIEKTVYDPGKKIKSKKIYTYTKY